MTAPFDQTVLYLRGVPRELVREAKAAAARQGRTLASLACSALELSLGSEAPSRPRDELRSDMDWFEKNRARLLARFPGEYVAIVDGALVDHDPEFSALAERVFARLGPRAVFMPRLAAQTSPRIRSPRLVRR